MGQDPIQGMTFKYFGWPISLVIFSLLTACDWQPSLRDQAALEGFSICPPEFDTDLSDKEMRYELALKGDLEAIKCEILSLRAELTPYSEVEIAENKSLFGAEWKPDFDYERGELLRYLFMYWHLSGEGWVELEAHAQTMSKNDIETALNFYLFDSAIRPDARDPDTNKFPPDSLGYKLIMLGSGTFDPPEFSQCEESASPRGQACRKWKESCRALYPYYQPYEETVRYRARLGERDALECQILYYWTQLIPYTEAETLNMRHEKGKDWQPNSDFRDQEMLLGALYLIWAETGEGWDQIEQLAQTMSKNDIETALYFWNYDEAVIPPIIRNAGGDFPPDSREYKLVTLGQGAWSAQDFEWCESKTTARGQACENWKAQCPNHSLLVANDNETTYERLRRGDIDVIQCEILYLDIQLMPISDMEWAEMRRRYGENWQPYTDEMAEIFLLSHLYMRWHLTGENWQAVEARAQGMSKEDISIALMFTLYADILHPPETDRCETLTPEDQGYKLLMLGSGEASAPNCLRENFFKRNGRWPTREEMTRYTPLLETLAK